jgi:hypothetical protein
MNPSPLSSSTLLFAGESLPITLVDGTSLSVRVRALPARHLNGYLDLRDVGREADLLAAVVQRPCAPPTAAEKADNPDLFPGWAPADAAFVDNLSDESHAALIELADKLNFSRAVCQAERQIATGSKLVPLKQQVAATMVKPLEQALHSLISSATTQLSAAVAAKTR